MFLSAAVFVACVSCVLLVFFARCGQICGVLSVRMVLSLSLAERGVRFARDIAPAFEVGSYHIGEGL